jgi:hypothetical protein
MNTITAKFATREIRHETFFDDQRFAIASQSLGESLQCFSNALLLPYNRIRIALHLPEIMSIAIPYQLRQIGAR